MLAERQVGFQSGPLTPAAASAAARPSAGKKHPRNWEERTLLFPNRSQGTLPGFFQRRATTYDPLRTATAACSLESAAAAFGFVIAAFKLFLPLMASRSPPLSLSSG